MAKNLAKERIGQTNKNNFGSSMEVVEYKNGDNVLVKFLSHGNLVLTTWRQFYSGQVRNPFDKSVFGVGFLGEGEYKSKEFGKLTRQYYTWHGMIERCYDLSLHKRHPTYLNCIVSEEWHNFQTFSEWYDKNHYQLDNERIQLDKDILIKGNKVYSPETCVFVPQNINKLFTKNDAKRGGFPIGVTWDKRDKIFVAQCSNGNNHRITIGRYRSPEEAFNAYKKYKEKLIKTVAEEYKSKIPIKLFEAMISYKVEITD